jgi:hypothetical protein
MLTTDMVPLLGFDFDTAGGVRVEPESVSDPAPPPVLPAGTVARAE